MNFFNSYSLQTKCSAVPEEAPETGTDEPVEKPPKKKKKKKKDLEPCEVQGGSTEPAGLADATMKDETDLHVSNSVNGLWEEEPPKKKKKKKHQEDQDQEPVYQGSDSSGYQSDHTKKRKKRKREEAESTPLVERAPKKKREK